MKQAVGDLFEGLGILIGVVLIVSMLGFGILIVQWLFITYTGPVIGFGLFAFFTGLCFFIGRENRRERETKRILQQGVRPKKPNPSG